jgi:transcription elongation factor Elf1
MTSLEDVIKKDQNFVCDKCKKSFKAKQVKFEDPINNFEILTPLMPFIFIDKNGVITGGTKMPQKELGDKVFCCPYCNQVHPFGFDLKK